jgi:PIN domain nuclease of toxin-antitoxin system
MSTVTGPAFPRRPRRLIGRDPCRISPMAVFELEILFELGRVRENSRAIVTSLNRQMASQSAIRFSSTFDRLIVANAMADGAQLLTADETILANFNDAVW